MMFSCKTKKLPKISKGKISLALDESGIKICWDGVEITSGSGLISAINTLGIFAHSSVRSDWQILERREDYFKTKVIFNDLPLSQAWTVKIENEQRLQLNIEMDVEELLHIDELAISCLFNSCYKAWVNNYQQGNFSRLSRNWQVIHQSNSFPSLLGVRFPTINDFLSSAMVEIETSEAENWTSLIQNSPSDINARVITFKYMDPEERKDYLPGSYNIFSGKISLFTEDYLLDDKIESLRRDYLEMAIQQESKKKESKRKLKVILANLPWQKDGKWGVRAGSRWPHIKDESEGNYLPFPFFLAYAATLLKKHGIDASIIDAIAEEIPQERFIERISALNVNYLVAETSVPSIYNDLDMLDKLSQAGISIILCGPNSEIYNPDFLKQYPFISFVLCGEYEFTLLELIKCLEENKDLSGVNGLIYRKDGDVIKPPPRTLLDINLLPWPQCDSLPMEKYCDIPGGMPMPSVQMLSSRGCPFNCNFCLWPQVIYQGNHYRARDINDVVNEMEYLVKEKKFKSVYFDDDTFNVDKTRMLDFSRAIKKRGLQNIPWAIMARADLMDEETLREMKSAGLWAIKYGVESSAQSFLESCNKGLDLSKTQEIIRLTNKLGIKTHLTFCFGFLGENNKTIQKTIDYGLKLKPYSVQFSILTPFPGTRLFEKLDKQGRILTRDWSKYDGHYNCVFKPDNLNPEELVAAKKKAYRLWDAGTKKKILPDLIGVSRNILCNYPDLLGVFNGRYAFKGPSYVQIDLTNNCNNNCLACWCNSPLLEEKAMPAGIKRQTLPFRLVKNLLDELHKMGTRDIHFSGGGEPFMHPQIMEILGYAKEKGFTCLVNTNFTLLDKEKLKRLVNLKVDHLTVSIWAATAKTYAITHPNKNEDTFLQIVGNLKSLNQLKQKIPHIRLYNVICNANYQELKGMIALAKDTGSESVEFAHIDTIPGKTDKIVLGPGQIEELQKDASEIAQGIDRNGYFGGVEVCRFDSFLRRLQSSSDLAKATYDRNAIDSMPCYIGWCFSRIMANGDVNACLKAHRIPTGNLYQQSFPQIWNGKKQRNFRKKTLVYEKKDPFFRLIGNDPDIKEPGCYKSCDDMSRNISIHNRIISLNPLEHKVAKVLARILPLKNG